MYKKIILSARMCQVISFAQDKIDFIRNLVSF